MPTKKQTPKAPPRAKTAKGTVTVTAPKIEIDSSELIRTIVDDATKDAGERMKKDVERAFSETPAIDAEKGVVDDDISDARTFYIGEHNILPPLPHRPVDAGHLADVCFASKYFGNLTPAQIAVHIIAGRSLGLDDIQSVFDLHIGPGPSIRWRDGQPFAATSDAIEAERAANMSTVADRPTPETASRAPDGASDAENVVITGNFGESGPGSAENVQNIDNFANKPPVLNADSEDRQSAGDTPAASSAAANLASAGTISDGQSTAEKFAKGFQNMNTALNEADLARADAVIAAGNPSGLTDEQVADQADAMTTFAIAGDPSGLIEPVDEPPGTITPDPVLTAAAAEVTSDVSAETVAAWRSAIENVCEELSIPKAEKLTAFDAANVVDKRKKFHDSQEYYSGKVDAVRAPVLEALAADGKDTLAKQQGFFIYAEVGTDPAGWNYAEAVKASTAATMFLKKP